LRLVPLVVVLVAMSAGGSVAGPGCYTAKAVPDGSSGTIFFDDTIADVGGTVPATSASCAASVAVVVPVGTIGVYKVDTRGFVNQSASDEATYSVTYASHTQSAVLNDSLNDSVPVTQYFATGPSSSFDGTFALDVYGTGDAGIDTVDVLAGYTTLGSVQASIDSLSFQQTSIVTRLAAAGEDLGGGPTALGARNYLSQFGAGGSDSFGLGGHYNLGGGFSVTGGLGYSDQSTAGASFTVPLLSASIGYLQPGPGMIRPFASLGATLAPGLSATYSRHYSDGTRDGQTIEERTRGNLMGFSAMAGMLFAPSADDEITFSASLTHSWLGSDGVAETIGNTNLFPASIAAGTTNFDRAKAGLTWKRRLAPAWDLTLSAALGETFAHDPVVADVAFVGRVVGDPINDAFAESGAQIDWHVSGNATASAYVLGATGTQSGTHLQVGEALKVAF
jgi:hypothetical protein